MSLSLFLDLAEDLVDRQPTVGILPIRQSFGD